MHGLIFGLIYADCGEHLFIRVGIAATVFGAFTWVVATAIKPYLDKTRHFIGGYDLFRLSHHLMTVAVGLAGRCGCGLRSSQQFTNLRVNLQLPGYHIYKADLSKCGQPTLTTIFYLASASYAGLVYLVEFFAGWLSFVDEMRVVDEDQQHVYLRVRVNPLAFRSTASRPLNFKPGQYAPRFSPFHNRVVRRSTARDLPDQEER